MATTSSSSSSFSSSSTPKDGQSPFTIRPAQPQDATAIATLGATVFTHTFADSGCTAAQLQAYLDEAYTPAAIATTLADPSQTTLVATLPEPDPAAPVILGFALLNRASTPSEPAIHNVFPRPVELQRLYVGLDAHGRGIGSALMRAAERVARDEGYETVWLGVWEANSRAQAVYGRLGYRKVGEHVFDVGGDAQTDWIMVKRL